MNLIPFPSNILKKKATPRVIHINTTYFRFLAPCGTCKKPEGIIAGVPTSFAIKIPMTEEEFENSYQKPFYISIAFDIRCNNGINHVAVKLGKEKNNFVVSDTPGMKQGYWEEDESLEKALYKFLPRFVTIKRMNSNFPRWREDGP